MKFCPYCGARYGDEAVACATDAYPLEASPRRPKEPWQQSVRALFSRGECRGKKFIAICNALAGINARYSDYTFGIERAAKISFRGQEVCVVLGDVGWPCVPSDRGTGWSRCRNVYALAASRDQIAWMTANSDAFSPVCAASNFPVFWVKPDAIRANQQGRANGKQPFSSETNRTSPAAASRRSP
jgi:hypothetical protein